MRKNRRRGGLATIFRKLLRPGTERLERQTWTQLDVKTTSNRGEKVRFRARTSWLIRALGFVVLLVSASLGVRWAYQHAFFTSGQHGEFQLTQLDILTSGTLSEAQIAEAAELKVGMNLLELDLVEIRERLEDQPLIIKAEIRREMPGRVEISVTEREMVAWLACPPHGVRARSALRGFLIDSDANVVELTTLSKEFLPLPVVETWRMPKADDDSEAGELTTNAIAAAVDLIKKSTREFSTHGVFPAHITLNTPWSMRCRFSNDLEVTFDRSNVDRGLVDLTHILNHAATHGLQVATVDLMMQKNIPVTYFNLSAPPRPMDPDDSPKANGTLRDLPGLPGQNEDAQVQQLRSILNRG